MIEQQYIKLMLAHEFYAENKSKVPLEVFSENARKALALIMWAHEKFERDFTLDEIKQLFFSQNPSLTTAQKNNFDIFLSNVEEADITKPDIAAYVLAGLWRQYVGTKVITLGSKYINGETDDLKELTKYVEHSGLEPFSELDAEPTTTELNELISMDADIPRWKFNIRSLSDRVSGIAAGELMVVLARPEVGKSQFIINMVAGPGGFAEQGAKTHLIYNEEPARRQVQRMYSSYTGMQWQEILDNREVAQAEFNKIKHNIKPIDCVGMTLNELDKYCSVHRPDIIIIDQLDRVTPNGRYEASHERLAEIYSVARDIAKRYNIAMIGVSQASAEAEGKAEVHYSHAEGSKTAKAATADLIVGIGVAGENSPVRVLNISKNKISGWHGAIAVNTVPSLSRYVS